jgi:cell division transport system permease protein
MKIAVLIDSRHESMAAEQKIRNQIEAIEGVKQVEYSSKEQEFAYYLEQYDDAAMREAMAPFGDDNPMSDAFYVEVEDGDLIETIASEIRGIEGVSDVDYGGQTTIDMVAAMITIRRFGLIFVAALSVLAIFLIQNTIKLTIGARQDEITIMRNVGATNGFIRAPFVWEGMIIGVLGAILPIALTVYGYYALYGRTKGVVFSSLFHLEQPMPFSAYISAILALTGILVGYIGSWLSVTKYLRWKR